MNEPCDNCGEPATQTMPGGHDGSRTFYYCDECLPPVGVFIQ